MSSRHKFSTKYTILIAFWLLFMGIAKADAQQLENPFAQARLWGGSNLTELLEIIAAEPFASESEFFDNVRRFVHENSVSSGDIEAVRYYYEQPDDMILRLLQSARGAGKGPDMECYTRTRAMMGLLYIMKIASRRVFVMTDAGEELRSHTFLEVFNKSTNKWEVQDPEFNLYYRYVDGRGRLSAKELAESDLSEFEPCQGNGKCGWVADGATLRNYFGLVILDRTPLRQSPLVFFRADRFDLAKRFKPSDHRHSIEGRLATAEEVIMSQWTDYGPPEITIFEKE